jgi:hypothetical protein
MEQFLYKLCDTHNIDIDRDVVISDWKLFDEQNTKYNKMKKPELVDICKAAGYAHVGSKPELITNILNKVEAVVKQTKLKQTKIKQEPLKTDILHRLKAKVPPIVIRRNVHGNYEHPDTGFIFNQKTHEVIGKQLDSGDISAISKTDLEECKKFNFQYVVPFNLTIAESGGEDQVLEDALEDELDEGNLVSVVEDEESEDEIEYDE